MSHTKERTKIPAFSIRKDVPLLVFLLILLLSVLCISFAPEKGNGNSHVEIRYEGTLLHEPNDETKSTAIRFPEKGEKEIVLTKEDGTAYGYPDGFAFLSEQLTITLSSDHSIQIREDGITCPDHLCVKMGKIRTSYTPLVCLPNHIEVMIVDQGFPEFDA